MIKCYITVKDEVWCIISGLKPSHAEVLWDKLGPHKDGYFWSPQYKLGRWDGRIRFFNKQTGKTYYRLLTTIVPMLAAWDYDIELRDERKPIENIPALVCENFFANEKIKLRPYQVEAVNLAIDATSGFIIAGTGAGKSLICAALCDTYGRSGYRTITVVPSADLVRQTADWYEICGLDVGIYCGDKKEIDHQHVVGTWQALQNNPHLLSFFQCFVWDEVHGAAANVAQKLMNENGVHIPFRYGVTGTFPKPEVDKLSLYSSIGDILTEIPASWLIENGYLAEVEIEPVELKENVDEEFIDYASERAYLAKSPSRIDFIADLIIAKAETYGNTLVLVSSIQFGKKLQKLIDGSVFLYGASEKEERKENYDLFETENNLIVIATFGIASTGISINRVFCEVMIDGGKSFIKAIQSVGRGTRLAHDKKKVHVVDLHSSLKWSKKHFRERKKYFKAAQYTLLPLVNYKIRN